MKILVPASTNIKELVKGLELTPTRSYNLKNKFYYFLSRIVSTNDNYKLNEDNNGFRNISSVLMKKVMGWKDYYLILETLKNPTDPMIESDDSWFSPKDANTIGYCKGYRLTEKYNNGEVVFKTLPKKFKQRIQKHIPEDKEREIITKKYAFLLDQFQEHRLRFDAAVYNYIEAFGLELLSRVENNNEYQTKMVLNLIGRWLYYVERIENNDMWYKVSPKNHRLNSSITNLKSTLRPFLLCNDKPLAMLDISSSQPYFLASIMKEEFISGTSGEFNLSSIYPELYNELALKGYIYNIDSTYSGSTFTFDNESSSSTGAGLDHYSFGNPTNSSSYMWGSFFNTIEKKSITQYQQSPFDQDFYKHLIKTSHTLTEGVDNYYSNHTGTTQEEITLIEERQKIKDAMMYILFDDNVNHRNNDEYIRLFKKVYPGVDKWITQAHTVIDTTKLSYVLQRCESYLLLNVIAREFHQTFPLAPIYTIHDAICTHEQYLPELKQLLLGRFYDITGAKVGIKIKSKKSNPKPKPEDIDEEWEDIKQIKTLKKYQDEHKSVFSSNIEKGANFLNIEISGNKGR